MILWVNGFALLLLFCMDGLHVEYDNNREGGDVFFNGKAVIL